MLDANDLFNNKSSTIHKRWVDYRMLKPDTVFENQVPRDEQFLYMNVKTEAAKHEKVHKPNFNLV